MRPTDCQNQCWFFLLILLLPIHGFTQRTISLKTSFQRQQKGRSFVISNKNNNNIININNNNVETTVGTTTSTLSESTIVVTTTPTKLTIRLEQHKPLGCTVEESLADPLKVFITKILPGSFADQAGLQIGDVIDGVSGFFGSVTATIGLEQVKQLVATRLSSDALEIQISRGTNVMAQHESALIDLCYNSDNETEMEQCLLTFLSFDDDDDDNKDDITYTMECNDQDLDCVLDGMRDLWNEDDKVNSPIVPAISTTATTTEISSLNNNTKASSRPWSSRSSPSGTWVRDPATGVMRNIDAD